VVATRVEAVAVSRYMWWPPALSTLPKCCRRAAGSTCEEAAPASRSHSERMSSRLSWMKCGRLMGSQRWAMEANEASRRLGEGPRDGVAGGESIHRRLH